MTFQGWGGQGFNWRTLLPGANYDYEAAAGDVWRNSTVAACLRWVKVNFPEPVLEVVVEEQAKPDANGKGRMRTRSAQAAAKHKQVNVLTDHDLVTLWNRPNKFYDRYTFSAVCSLSALVDGNCYIRKIRAKSGKVVELWWLPHWMCWPRWNPDGTEFIGWYDYEVNGKVERIEVEDMIHFKMGVDPRDDRRGFSDLKTAIREVCGLNECDTYTSAIMRNMGIPGVVISTSDPDASFNPAEIPVLQDQFREMFTSEGRGSAMFAPRLMKVEKLSFSPEELALDKIPSRLEDRVCAVLGLNPMVVNLTSGAAHKTYANYGESRRAAYEDCLIPFQKAWAECLTHQLLKPEYSEGTRCRWDYSGCQCLAENETEVAERVGKQYQVYQTITRAEAREMQGLDWTTEDEIYFSEAVLRTVDEEDIIPEEDRPGGPNELAKGSAKTKVKAGADKPDAKAPKADDEPKRSGSNSLLMRALEVAEKTLGRRKAG